MSISHCLLVLFVCLISLHACNCNARRLASVDDHYTRKLHVLDKNEYEKKDIKRIPAAAETKPLKNIEHGIASISKTSFVADHDKTHQKKQRDSTKANAEKTTTSTSAGDQYHKSPVSVSWRVPHPRHDHKRKEKHPGFNSDYSPPKTHPPSHN